MDIQYELQDDKVILHGFWDGPSPRFDKPALELAIRFIKERRRFYRTEAMYQEILSAHEGALKFLEETPENTES